MPYMYAGCSMPSTFRVFSNCLRTYSVTHSSAFRRARSFFRQNVVFVIEVVERLRELKRILGHVRRLARRDGALDGADAFWKQ